MSAATPDNDTSNIRYGTKHRLFCQRDPASSKKRPRKAQTERHEPDPASSSLYSHRVLAIVQALSEDQELGDSHLQPAELIVHNEHCNMSNIPSPEPIKYVYRNCLHDHTGPVPFVGPTYSDIYNTKVVYIVDPLLCESCSMGPGDIDFLLHTGWVHWGCKHQWTMHPEGIPADLRVQQMSKQVLMDVNVLHPRWCPECLVLRENTLRLMPRVVGDPTPDRRDTSSMELSFTRGVRDGRMLAQSTDFKWGIEGVLSTMLTMLEPDQTTDAITIDPDDDLMNQLADSLHRFELAGQFSDVDALVSTLSLTSINDPQFSILVPLSGKYNEGKVSGLYFQ